MPVWIRGVLFHHTSVHYQPVSYQLPGPIRQAIESLLHPHPASSAESPCIQQRPMWYRQPGLGFVCHSPGAIGCFCQFLFPESYKLCKLRSAHAIAACLVLWHTLQSFWTSSYHWGQKVLIETTCTSCPQAPHGHTGDPYTVTLFCHYHQTLPQVDKALQFFTPFPWHISELWPQALPLQLLKRGGKTPSGRIHSFFITIVKIPWSRQLTEGVVYLVLWLQR